MFFSPTNAHPLLFLDKWFVHIYSNDSYTVKGDTGEIGIERRKSLQSLAAELRATNTRHSQPKSHPSLPLPDMATKQAMLS